MPKQKRTAQTPIGAADLTEYLQSSDDFQLELDVFRSCCLGPFDAEHGGTYKDPTTNKDRQFDIRLRCIQGLCTLKLAIECKNLKASFPLLVSRVPRRPTESFHDVILSSPARFERALKSEPFTGADTCRLDGTLFEPKQSVGKSTVQVGRALGGEIISGDAEVYEKWSQAIGSAFDLVSASTHDYVTTGGHVAVTAVFPILVLTDGTLWVADYSEQGELLGAPRPCEECSIFLGKPVSTGLRGVDYTFSHLQVFTKTKFDGYLDRLLNGKYWDRIFPKTLNETVARFRQEEADA